MGIGVSDCLPENLRRLHQGEEILREQSLTFIEASALLRTHVTAIEHAMDVADQLRQLPDCDDDLATVKILSMRIFNAFAGGLKLALSGYGQLSAMVMRDILETTFLLGLFAREPALVSEWRTADRKVRWSKFRPDAVRKRLDELDGFNSQRRKEHYYLLSELAAHPSDKSHLMLRPIPAMDATSGPFVEESSLDAVLSEMAKIALVAGEALVRFFPSGRAEYDATKNGFCRFRDLWISDLRATQSSSAT